MKTKAKIISSLIVLLLTWVTGYKSLAVGASSYYRDLLDKETINAFTKDAICDFNYENLLIRSSELLGYESALQQCNYRNVIIVCDTDYEITPNLYCTNNKISGTLPKTSLFLPYKHTKLAVPYITKNLSTYYFIPEVYFIVDSYFKPIKEAFSSLTGAYKVDRSKELHASIPSPLVQLSLYFLTISIYLLCITKIRNKYIIFKKEYPHTSYLTYLYTRLSTSLIKLRPFILLGLYFSTVTYIITIITISLKEKGVVTFQNSMDAFLSTLKLLSLADFIVERNYFKLILYSLNCIIYSLIFIYIIPTVTSLLGSVITKSIMLTRNISKLRLVLATLVVLVFLLGWYLISLFNLRQNSDIDLLQKINVQGAMVIPGYFEISNLRSSLAFKTMPGHRVFINNYLIFDPNFTKINNKPFSEYSNSVNRVLISRSNRSYLASILHKGLAYTKATSTTFTKYFAIEILTTTLYFDFSCAKNPNPHSLSFYVHVENETSPRRMDEISFPGCIEGEELVTYQFPLLLWGEINNRIIEIRDFEKSGIINIRDTQNKPVKSLKDPEVNPIIFERIIDPSSNEINIFSLDETKPLEIVNTTQTVDIGKWLETIYRQYDNSGEYFIWSDTPLLYLEKITE